MKIYKAGTCSIQICRRVEYFKENLFAFECGFAAAAVAEALHNNNNSGIIADK